MRIPFLKSSCLLALVVVLIGARTAQATVIQQYTSGINGASDYYWGQSFTTPGSGPWNNVTFNFYSNDTGDPLAEGTAYLFSSPYLGLGPNGLPSASGILAKSTSISGGKYIFSSTFDLQPNTTYYLYEDTVMMNMGICDALACGTSGVQGDAFFSQGPSVYYGEHSNYITNYSVEGLPDAGVPEPAAIGTFFLGIGFIALKLHYQQGPGNVR